MKIIWLYGSLLDLHSIREYYSEVASEAIANQQLSKIYAATGLLMNHPYIGHVSTLDNSGELFKWVIPNTHYTIPYPIVDEEILIYRVFDSRQERPDSWDE